LPQKKRQNDEELTRIIFNVFDEQTLEIKSFKHIINSKNKWENIEKTIFEGFFKKRYFKMRGG
jgi:hypothetical protein